MPTTSALSLCHPAGAVALRPATPLVLGSSAAADLRVPDRYVSARHARVVAPDGRFVVEDLGSTNGTWVDGVRIDRAYLAAGMQIQLGGWRASIQGSEPTAMDHPGRLGMVGQSPAYLGLERLLLRFAPLSQPVLLRGETGTGKELAARALHDHSPRRDHPFVALNCGAIPEGLCESELFGHVRGAFTGAHRNHVGAFARAHTGTLFLDEVAELPLPLQAKLLRVLETSRVQAVGAENDQSINVRVVTATHQSLPRLAACGRFRSDLYHRLGALEVELPPLRHRGDDIPALLEFFATQLQAEFGRPIQVTARAIAAARQHAWPGNIRELRNALLRAAATCDGPITAEDLIPMLMPQSPDVAHDLEAWVIPRGTYVEMQHALLRQVVAEVGSIRKAATQLDVPRSTLSAWLQHARSSPPDVNLSADRSHTASLAP